MPLAITAPEREGAHYSPRCVVITMGGRHA